jgi:type II secretory pathway pseudopilin PulG
MRKWNSESGMSLVEATIILMVLAILTATIAPSLADYVEDARQVKAKEDVEAIGTAIKRLVRDTGLGCLSDTPSPASASCTQANRIDLLTSNGNDPASTAATYAEVGTVFAGTTAAWIGGGGNLTQTGTMDAHLVTNGPSYSLVSFTLGGGPRQGVGWRGAYLTGPIGGDPWGYKYQSNTLFLIQASDGANGAGGNGDDTGGWINDVIVVSPGPDGDVKTVFASDATGATTVTGDDVVYVVSGSSR